LGGKKAGKTEVKKNGGTVTLATEKELWVQLMDILRDQMRKQT